MKKLIIALSVFLALFTTACGAAPDLATAKDNPMAVSATANIKKVRITIDGRSGVLNLYDTPVSNELYKLLPLTLSFSDFNSTEKIATPSKPIHEGYKPEGHAPKAGRIGKKNGSPSQKVKHIPKSGGIIVQDVFTFPIFHFL